MSCMAGGSSASTFSPQIDQTALCDSPEVGKQSVITCVTAAIDDDDQQYDCSSSVRTISAAADSNIQYVRDRHCHDEHTHQDEEVSSSIDQASWPATSSIAPSSRTPSHNVSSGINGVHLTSEIGVGINGKPLKGMAPDQLLEWQVERSLSFLYGNDHDQQQELAAGIDAAAGEYYHDSTVPGAAACCSGSMADNVTEMGLSAVLSTLQHLITCPAVASASPDELLQCVVQFSTGSLQASSPNKLTGSSNSSRASLLSENRSVTAGYRHQNVAGTRNYMEQQFMDHLDLVGSAELTAANALSGAQLNDCVVNEGLSIFQVDTSLLFRSSCGRQASLKLPSFAEHGDWWDELPQLAGGLSAAAAARAAFTGTVLTNSAASSSSLSLLMNQQAAASHHNSFSPVTVCNSPIECDSASMKKPDGQPKPQLVDNDPDHDIETKKLTLQHRPSAANVASSTAEDYIRLQDLGGMSRRGSVDAMEQRGSRKGDLHQYMLVQRSGISCCDDNGITGFMSNVSNKRARHSHESSSDCLFRIKVRDGNLACSSMDREALPRRSSYVEALGRHNSTSEVVGLVQPQKRSWSGTAGDPVAGCSSDLMLRAPASLVRPQRRTYTQTVAHGTSRYSLKSVSHEGSMVRLVNQSLQGGSWAAAAAAAASCPVTSAGAARPEPGGDRSSNSSAWEELFFSSKSSSGCKGAGQEGGDELRWRPKGKARNGDELEAAAAATCARKAERQEERAARATRSQMLAGERRKRVQAKMQELRGLVPAGDRAVNNAALHLDMAIKYVHFLRAQVNVLAAHHHHHQSQPHLSDNAKAPAPDQQPQPRSCAARFAYSEAPALAFLRRLLSNQRIQESLSRHGSCLATLRQAHDLHYHRHCPTADNP